MRVISKILFVALSLCALGVLVWRHNINELQLKQQREVVDIIRTTIKSEVQKDQFLPELVFINADSSSKKELTDSIVSQITAILIEKYQHNRNISNEYIALKPFFVLPNEPDSSGNYFLTKREFRELIAHIDFFTKQVEIEVDRTKEEVGRDIDRLNTWVSIWIGVIGFLGIFIPIVLNFDVSKRASEAKEEASKAKTDSELGTRNSEKATKESNEALQKINGAQTQIDKINGLEEKVNNALQKSNTAHEKAESAKSDTIEVKRNLSVIIAINKLKEFSPQTLIQLDKENILPYYIKILESILKELKENAENTNLGLMKNWLGQVAINCQNVSLYRFINSKQTKLLNEYSELIFDALKDYDQQKFKQIVSGLEELIKKLKIE